MKRKMKDFSNWVQVSCPIKPDDCIPAERRVVLVWVDGKSLPFCGYIRYSAGDERYPYFVVYHGNSDIGANVIAWCDCLPDEGPGWVDSRLYDKDQPGGRGFKARKESSC